MNREGSVNPFSTESCEGDPWTDQTDMSLEKSVQCVFYMKRMESKVDG